MQREVDQRHEGVATLLLPALKGGAPVAPRIPVDRRGALAAHHGDDAR